MKLSKRQWSLLFFISFFITLFSQIIEQSLNQQMIRAMQSESSSFITTAAALFFNNIFFVWLQTVLLLTVFQEIHPETQNIPLWTQWGDFSREWLRSMGDASLWVFALVVPGLVRWIDYTILPFICFFDSEYQNGSADALLRCRNAAQPIRGRLWLLFLFVGVLLPLLLTSLFGQYESFSDYPWQATALVITEAMIQILSFWALWRLYLKTRPLS